MKVFVSESPQTKILIAKVPIDPPSYEYQLRETDKVTKEKRLKTRSLSNSEFDSNDINFGNFVGNFFNFFRTNLKPEDLPYEINLSQDDLTEFTVTFLDFATNSSQIGSVCNKAICCNYSIEVSDNGEVQGKVF